MVITPNTRINVITQYTQIRVYCVTKKRDYENYRH